jgi:hypothetical protein
MIQPNLPAEATLSVRITPHENHHLWNNNGTWWLHYTVHYPDYTHARIRRSLKTRKVEEARQRRDQYLAEFPGHN